MNLHQFHQDTWAHPAGTVIRVKYGLYDHVGMLSDRAVAGERCVMAFSAEAGGFVEQPLMNFACGQAITVEGYLGVLPSVVVMHRARMKRGLAYSWMAFNCEHFVRYAHGVGVESPQLRLWAFLGCIAGLLTMAVH